MMSTNEESTTYLIKELHSGQIKIVEEVSYKESYWYHLLKYVEEHYGSSN